MTAKQYLKEVSNHKTMAKRLYDAQKELKANPNQVWAIDSGICKRDEMLVVYSLKADRKWQSCKEEIIDPNQFEYRYEILKRINSEVWEEFDKTKPQEINNE